MSACVRLLLAVALLLGGSAVMPQAVGDPGAQATGGQDGTLVTTIHVRPGEISVDRAPTFTFSAPTREDLRFRCSLLAPGDDAARVDDCTPAVAATDGTTTGTISYPALRPGALPYSFTVQAYVPATTTPVADEVAGPVSAAYRWRVYSVTAPMHYVPRTGASFNNPLGSKAAQRRNLRRAISTIRSMPGYLEPSATSAPCPRTAAEAPSRIRVSLYSMTDARFANAMAEAAGRCVSVQLLMNNHLSATTDPAFRTLQRALGTKSGARSFARRCSYGCRGKGVLHTKMYLFDSRVPAPLDLVTVNRIRRTVMFGSSNMTQNAAKVQWNDLYTVAGKTKLYDAYAAYFDLMRKDHGFHRNVGRFGVSAGYPTTFWPVRPRHRDPELAALSSISCSGVRGGTGLHGHTVVSINMHAWFGARGLRFVDRVRSLYARGCYVRILYSFMTPQVHGRLARGTGSRLSLRRTIFSLDRDRYADVYSHFKNIMASGHVGGDRSARVVWTGSNNFTSDGDHFDEMMVAISSAAAYRAYHRQFAFISRRKSSGRYASFLEPVGGGRAPGKPGRTTLAAPPGTPTVLSPDAGLSPQGRVRALD